MHAYASTWLVAKNHRQLPVHLPKHRSRATGRSTPNMSLGSTLDRAACGRNSYSKHLSEPARSGMHLKRYWAPLNEENSRASRNYLVRAI